MHFYLCMFYFNKELKGRRRKELMWSGTGGEKQDEAEGISRGKASSARQAS